MGVCLYVYKVVKCDDGGVDDDSAATNNKQEQKKMKKINPTTKSNFQSRQHKPI